MPGVYKSVGRRMPGAQAPAMKAGEAAYNASIALSKAKRVGVGSADRIAQGSMNSAMESIYRSRGRKPALMGLGIGLAAGASAMRPGPMSQQTGYSGPRPMTSAPPSSGRYA